MGGIKSYSPVRVQLGFIAQSLLTQFFRSRIDAMVNVNENVYMYPTQAFSSSIDYQHFAAFEKNCLTSTQSTKSSAGSTMVLPPYQLLPWYYRCTTTATEVKSSYFRVRGNNQKKKNHGSKFFGSKGPDHLFSNFFFNFFYFHGTTLSPPFMRFPFMRFPFTRNSVYAVFLVRSKKIPFKRFCL